MSKFKDFYKFVSMLGINVVSDDIGGEAGSFINFSVTGKMKFIEVEMNPSLFIKSPEKARLNLLSNIAHEVGHYLAAPKSRRDKNNFGLPKSTDKRIYKYYYFAEEMKAQLIENHILEYFKIEKYNVNRNFRRQKAIFVDFPELKNWWNKFNRQHFKPLMIQFEKKKQIDNSIIELQF